jgi:hypothetical protein
MFNLIDFTFKKNFSKGKAQYVENGKFIIGNLEKEPVID